MHLHPGATFQHLGPDQVVANTKEHWLVICGDKEAAKACLVELPRKTQNNYRSRAGTQLGPGWGHSRPMPKESQYCMFVMSLIQTKASLRKPYSEFVLEPDSEPGAAEDSGSDAEQHCGKAEHPPAESRASYEYYAGSESEDEQDKSECAETQEAGGQQELSGPSDTTPDATAAQLLPSFNTHIYTTNSRLALSVFRHQLQAMSGLINESSHQLLTAALCSLAHTDLTWFKDIHIIIHQSLLSVLL